MLSAPGLRSFFASMRTQLVIWITLTVILLDVATNLIVSEIEQRLLRRSYDQFLVTAMDEVEEIVKRSKLSKPSEYEDELKRKIGTYENRSLFVQIYDENKKLVWTTTNAPPLAHATLNTEFNTPFDQEKHRVFVRRAVNNLEEPYYVRCGFLQVEVQEDIQVLNRSLLVASLSTALFIPLGAYFIARRAARPLTQIITKTAHLQPRNLHERLPIRGVGDEIDQLSQTINGLLDRLALYLSQNRDFVANAAHELRSPLAAIRTSVEVGLNMSRTQEEYSAIMSDVMEEIDRLSGLVNRLLILAEGDAGRVAGTDQQTQLDKIVRESVDMFDAVAESCGVRLMVGDLQPALVPGDESYLRQVVRNLIDNAIKYNRNPGEVSIQLGMDAAMREAILSVKDTGVGIAPEVLPRIFERFYRADQSRSREKERAGHGLGLSICQTVVEALHGKIDVESNLGQGSTFTVCLPLAESVGRAGSQNKSTHSPGTGPIIELDLQVPAHIPHSDRREE